MEALAREAGVSAPLDLLPDPSWRESLALGTYGEQLLRRVAGTDHSGVANLALWRRFAWTSTGAPKRGFVLRASMMVNAQSRVIEHLQDAA